MPASADDRSQPSPYDPVSLFGQEVPDLFLRDVTRVVALAYRAADEKVRDEFEEPERRDLFPHHRRAIIERELRGVAARHGLVGTPQKNKKKTSSFSRVTCGRVIMTASAVRESTEIVRYAEFRLGFARSSQRTLFGEAEPVVPNAPLYAIILHGPGAIDRDEEGNAIPSTSKPGFVDVVFPAPVAGTKDKIEYVGGRINLLQRFPEVLAGPSTVVTTEQVEFAVEPTLRQRVVRKEAGA